MFPTQDDLAIRKDFEDNDDPVVKLVDGKRHHNSRVTFGQEFRQGAGQGFLLASDEARDHGAVVLQGQSETAGCQTAFLNVAAARFMSLPSVQYVSTLTFR